MARGGVWSIAELVCDKLGNLIAFALVVRLLPPEAYGLFALAWALLTLGTIAMDLGLTVALVQRRELTGAHLDAAFWASMATSFGFALLLGVAAWAAAALLPGQADLMMLLAALGATVPLMALGRVQKALMIRRFAFRNLTVRAAAATLAGGVTAVAMVYSGLGVWSLVGQQVAYYAAGTAALWLLSDWRPRRRMPRQAMRELWAFGRTVMASQSLDYVNRRSDTLLVGFVLGTAALGFYSVAYKLVLVVSDGLLVIVGALALPAFARLQDEPGRLGRAYANAVKLAATVALPMLVGLAAVAETAIPLLFGPTWVPSIALLYALVPLSLAQVLFYVEDGLMMALDRVGWRLWLNVAYGVAGLIVFFAAAPYGLLAVAWALAARGVVFMPIGFLLSRQLAPIALGQYLRQYGVPCLAALALGAAAWGTGEVLAGTAPTVRLIAQIGAGVLAYGAVWLGVDRSYLVSLLANVRTAT